MLHRPTSSKSIAIYNVMIKHALPRSTVQFWQPMCRATELPSLCLVWDSQTIIFRNMELCILTILPYIKKNMPLTTKIIKLTSLNAIIGIVFVVVLLLGQMLILIGVYVEVLQLPGQNPRPAAGHLAVRAAFF